MTADYGQIAEAFWAQVTKLASGCWVYGEAPTGNSYRIFSCPGFPPISAHRLAYILTYGDIAEELDVHHRCRHKYCVNPSHLKAATKVDHHAMHRVKVSDNVRRLLFREFTEALGLGDFEQLCKQFGLGVVEEEPRKGKRGYRSGFCSKGHAYDRTDTEGNGRCRLCANEANRLRKLRLRQTAPETQEPKPE